MTTVILLLIKRSHICLHVCPVSTPPSKGGKKPKQEASKTTRMTCHRIREARGARSPSRKPPRQHARRSREARSPSRKPPRQHARRSREARSPSRKPPRQQARRAIDSAKQGRQDPRKLGSPQDNTQDVPSAPGDESDDG